MTPARGQMEFRCTTRPQPTQFAAEARGHHSTREALSGLQDAKIAIFDTRIESMGFAPGSAARAPPELAGGMYTSWR
jgi:hypothetical protein